MSVGVAPRAAALAAVRAVDAGAWSTRAVPDAIAELPDVRDRALAAHLAHGTIRWRGTLDWTLQQVVSRPLESVEEALAQVLRLGVFQLRHSRVPARAAVDTSVELARASVPGRRGKGAAGFVNGVLRTVDRRGSALDAMMASNDDEARIALQTGHPEWIVGERLAALDDAATVEVLLAADNEPPGLTLRAMGDRDSLVATLRADGIEAEPTAHAALGVRAPGTDPRRLAVVANGTAVPQDEASMLVGAAVGVTAGDRVVDLCAAPGGKAIDLAVRAGPTGRVTAVELHPSRARLVTEAATRVGVDLDVVVGDALEVDLPRDVDAVLVDAPCTGLGVGRRRPEVRWRRHPEDLPGLASLQAALVGRAIELVRDGGRVTYSVCTWTVAETTDVVAAVEAASPRPLTRGTMRQLRPDVDGTDGMFHVTWQVGDAASAPAAS
ncbi:MAG TPA: transcription antitermination factor NusB [Nitriliruptoraceae bacterium]|nr:transcription antitermination factor NusB [Nitriliruptoraceae bacterium]